MDQVNQNQVSNKTLTSNVSPPREWIFPLSFSQQRLWLLEQLDPGNTSYSIPWSLRLIGTLDAEALEKSLNEIVRRHEALRSTFRQVNGAPVQVVTETVTIPLALCDLTGEPVDERETAALRIVKDEARLPLDLEKGPLVRARLIHLDSREHIFLLTLHHIIFDGWSRRVFARELAAFYGMFHTGKLTPLPELGLQYPDYVLWQRNHLKGKFLRRELEYWKQQLSGAPASLNLPTDRPRPAVQSYRGISHPVSLASENLDRVRLFAREHGASLFMVLLAAFQAVLARYSGDNDILVGTPIANRTQAKTEELIGLFANTLVLRGNLAGDPTFGEIVERVKQTSLDAYAHQDVPFEKLVEELNPERSLSHNPIFQVLFSLQNTTRQAFELSGLEVKPFGGTLETAKFELSIYLSESENGISGRIEYNTDLYDRETIIGLWRHYEVLLAAGVDDPGLGLSELPLLSQWERSRMLEEWNQTNAEYRDGCVHEWFEEQVRRTPEAVACLYKGSELTYRQLNEQANQLGRYLRRQGATPGQRVAIFAERSLALLVGLLGIQKSGAAYVPVDPAYPAERIRQILEQAQVVALVTQLGLEANLPDEASRIYLDADWEVIAQESGENLTPCTQAEDALYVMFTSGSTGKPKGVEVPHRAVVNLLTSMERELHMGSDDVFPALASFAFDMCIPELYLALVTGGRVALAPAGLAGDGAELANFLKQVGATVVHATPTTWRLLLDTGFTGKGLKRAIGAEALPPELCARLLEIEPSLYNFYGPTETTVWSTMHHFQDPRDAVAIGRPLANTRIYILDSHQQPVPVGVEGELYIGGAGVAHGYLNRPDLTAERFLADPFQEQGRIYRTGDRARYRAEGRIEYLGRVDLQVKLRGYRIELGEIEVALARYPGVAESVAAIQEDTPGDQRLVGFVVAQPGAVLEEAALRNWVKERLPEYMVPIRVVTLERFALTPNGKVDRKRLPAVEYRRLDDEQAYRPAETPIEEVIRGIWAEVLKLDRVGVEDDFFHLGGHSLLGTQVVSRVRAVLQVELPLRALFEAPRVRALAERVEALRSGEHRRLLPPLECDLRRGRLPLSLAQQRLWFLDQLEPGNAMYNVPYLVRLTGALDLSVFERSLNEILRRHEALRTRFVMGEDEPAQVIDAWEPLTLNVTSLRDWPEGEKEAEARRQVLAEIQQPFDLSRGPVLRARIWVLDEGDDVFLLNTHHIVSDRWSLGVLAGELATLYQAYSRDQLSPLPDLPVQYADYALWQRKYLDDRCLEPQLAYWKHELDGAPPLLDLPTDHPHSGNDASTGAQLSATLPKQLSDSLKSFSGKEGASLFMTVLSVFNILLARYSGQDDVVVGTPIAGRNHLHLERLIGFFVNTLPLRSRVSGDLSFRALLSRTRETVINAYAHQDVPFDRLVEHINPERGSGRNPLFRVMLMVQNTPSLVNAFGAATISPFPVQSQTAKFDLTLIVTEGAGGLRFIFDYNTDLFDASTIERMQAHFINLLEQALAEPDTAVSRLQLLSEAEQHLVVSEWNATAREYRRDVCLQDLFRDVASRNFRKTAVVCGNQQLSYAELDERSYRLASYLRKRGVGPECLVGLLVSRSVEMVVALLGILKAGAAYVPIDPAYPKERIAVICDDTKMALLLTERSLSELLPSLLPSTIYLDTEWPQISQSTGAELPRNTTPESLAYVIFTSGSTGRPKGVQITHRNLANFLMSMASEPGLRASDKLLAVTSLSFDIAALELYLPLITGATVLIASREQTLDGRLLAELILRSQPTVLQATPATWRMLIESGWSGSPQLRALCGGEPLTSELAGKLLPRCSELWNMYGPTETTVWSSIYQVKSPLKESVPIGRPIANTKFYILDEAQRPVAVGIAGELYIGGEGVALGYLDRRELTEERFLPDPFALTGRMYRTGDLAKFLPDGNVVCLGRTDNQVKLRGYRIELGEIESTMLLHPEVQGCAALVLEDPTGEKRLAAYYVARQSTEVDPGSLRAYLKKTLPDYLIPSFFVQLASLPLTSGGKIDRRALLKHVPLAPLKADGGEPSDDFELVLLYVWKRLLGIRSCRITDNFFELGGHSLLLVRMAAMIEEEFGKVVPMSVLFKSPTIEQIAAFLREGISDVSGFFVPMQKGGIGVPIFLIHSIIGDVVGCRQLIRHLDPDQRVYGIQIPTEFRQAEWMSSVETIASRYVEELLKFEPQGPYNLGGWSAGAPIALEMAQQLRNRGFNVPLLVSIDAAPPNTGGGTTRSNPLYYLKLLQNLPGVIQREFSADFSWHRLRQRTRRLRTRLIKQYSFKRRSIQMLAQYRVARFLGPAEYSDSAKKFMSALYLTLQKYVPQRYDGKVVLYQTRAGSPFRLHEPDRKWRRIASEVEVVPVGGNHVTLMLGKHVEGLARHLNQRLAECRLWEAARKEAASVSIGVSAGENDCSPGVLADVRR